MVKILVADPIAKEGVALLQQAGEVLVKTGLAAPDLIAVIPDFDALVVRSETKVTADVLAAAKRLQVVGRAGVGVDNIDIKAATRRGITVVNAPTGNIVAAAEHTVALLLAVARHVAPANAALRQGQWQRSKYTGIEVRKKTLGLIGLGKVGSEVARLLAGFNMRRIAHDPFISPDYAKRLNVELVSLETLLRESDFVTIHLPLLDSTRNIIAAPQLAMMKPTAYIVNTARGGLINEDALLEAVDKGIIAGAAVDVFEKEPQPLTPLVAHPKVLTTPHLGASTTEAQRDVGIEIAEEIMAVLRGKASRNVLNLPVLPPEVHAVIAPFIPVAQIVGQLLTGLAIGQPVGITMRYEGAIAKHATDTLKAGVLQGLLSHVTAERVNIVNATLFAAQRGLAVSEERSEAPRIYESMITGTLKTDQGETTVAATLYHDQVHVVRVNEYWLDMVPSVPHLLFIEHHDRPGMIGAVGSATGRHNVNISFMEVGRLSPRGAAMMVLGLDDPMPQPALDEVRAIAGIKAARVVDLEGNHTSAA